MEKNGKKLGEYLYEHLANNEYLIKLMDDLSLQYALGGSRIKSVQVK